MPLYSVTCRTMECDAMLSRHEKTHRPYAPGAAASTLGETEAAGASPEHRVVLPLSNIQPELAVTLSENLFPSLAEESSPHQMDALRT